MNRQRTDGDAPLLEIARRLRELERRPSSASGVEDELADHEARITANTNGLATTDGNLTALSGTVAGHTTTLSSHGGRLTTAEGNITALSSALDARAPALTPYGEWTQTTGQTLSGDTCLRWTAEVGGAPVGITHNATTGVFTIGTAGRWTLTMSWRSTALGQLYTWFGGASPTDATLRYAEMSTTLLAISVTKSFRFAASAQVTTWAYNSAGGAISKATYTGMPSMTAVWLGP